MKIGPLGGNWGIYLEDLHHSDSNGGLGSAISVPESTQVLECVPTVPDCPSGRFIALLSLVWCFQVPQKPGHPRNGILIR